MRRFDNNREKRNFVRINFQIRCPNVRLMEDGKQLGIYTADKARRMAQDKGLDLIETVSNANPPVCIIASFEKYRYEEQKKRKELEKKQRDAVVEIKEIRLRPGIHEHDVMTKLNSIKKFIDSGKKVQITMMFYGRKIDHREEGFKVINKIITLPHLYD